MKKPVLLVLGLALVLAGALLAWLFNDSGRRGNTPKADVETERAEKPSLDSGPVAELQPAERAAETPENGALPRQERETAAEAQDGRVLEGSVSLPAGAPADESLRVLAFAERLDMNAVYADGGALAKHAREAEKRAWIGEARVASDGRFRLALGTAAEVFLAIDGRFLYSRELASVPADTNNPALAAELGACIQGRVSLPVEVTDPAQVLAQIELKLRPDPSQISLASGRTNFQSRAARVDAEGRYELRAAACSQVHALALDSDACADYTRGGIELAQGELRTLDITLELGATLRGTVQDDRGQVLAGAKVRAAESAMWGFAAGSRAEVESDENGRFVLAHVPAGRSLIVAEKDGYLTSEVQRVELVDREDRAGLVLELGRGASLSGRVRFSDGAPAAGGTVRVSFDLEAMMGAGAGNAQRGAEGKAVADAAGEFEVTGLGKGPFTIEASLARKSADGVEEPWSAKLTKVAPDSHGLELTLAAPCALSGRVLAPDGTPVERFHLALTLPGAVFFDPGKSRGENVVDAQGQFRVRGLEPGKWQVQAGADGFGPMAPLEVLLPRAADEAPLVLTLQPEASVAGSVLDPDGRPLAGARVTTPSDLTETIRRMRDASGVPQTLSDAEGRFVLTGLGPSVKAILATHERFAPSEALALELAPGEKITDVSLRLQRGARVTGEVYDKVGVRADGVQIVAQNRGTFETSMSRTDGNGEFAFEHLAAGPWTITAMMNEAAAAGAPDSLESTASFLDNLRMEMVDLAEGEEKHVVLGAPPEAPVTVHGIVRHGKEPVTQGLVSFMPDGMKSMQSMKMASLGGDGTFTVKLDAPGAYIVSVQASEGGGGMQQNTVEFRERVPEAEEHRLELELPLAGIRGLVRGPDGAPAAGTRVTLTTEGGLQTGSMLGGHYAEASTDAHGRYTFRYLRPGTYSVAAGGALFGGAFGGSSSAGRVLRSGITVAEGRLVEGVDFELAPPCDIKGRVLDGAGAPVKDAAIFVRDSEGRLLDRFSMITSGADGTFAYTGVAPGDYLVSARAKELASSDSAPVRAAADAPGEVELRLAAGTRLIVEVLDPEGVAAQAMVTVLDARGREVQGMIGLTELSSTFSQGFDSTRQTIGPVPPGTYTVIAVAGDGTRVKKPVTLDGQPERHLKLRLKD
jgi:protocatechuate 3,4-dioxygenase beta subunit